MHCKSFVFLICLGLSSLLWGGVSAMGCDSVCTDTCDFGALAPEEVGCIEMKCELGSPARIRVDFILNGEPQSKFKNCSTGGEEVDECAFPSPQASPQGPQASPRNPAPREPVCATGSWGECEGAFGDWDKEVHKRTYEGEECRTTKCDDGSSDEECQACSYEEEDFEAPTCTASVDWTARPLELHVIDCQDEISGCDEESYQSGKINEDRTGMNPASACDMAGNCVECEVIGMDDQPPTCTVTFEQPEQWHRGEDFEINGGTLRCMIETCEDVDQDGDEEAYVASGCLPLGTLEDTLKTYDDPGGMIELVEVELNALDPAHQDICVMQVCDNAGNCGICESEPVSFDGTSICQSADGDCPECAEDDWDCFCIGGDLAKCTDEGPVNCYHAPFNPQCPGFDNPACLEDAFTPGCPVINPCYPEQNRGEQTACPDDAIRFCSRNPYHYGCNEACRLGLIECDPEAPEVVEVAPLNQAQAGAEEAEIDFETTIVETCEETETPEVCPVGKYLACALSGDADCQICECVEDAVECPAEPIVCEDLDGNQLDQLCTDMVNGCQDCRCVIE